MDANEKRKRFLRIAQKRTTHVIENLQSLGNCSNPATYLYDVRELEPIFSAIEAEVAATRARMEAQSPYRQVPFTLSDRGSREEEAPEHE
ncbi:hypothetical protein SDC9_83280 [bioreactor metagenome]|uniref:Uncharacterized protein n=1 Tax=bioreactor metagenome TaxID=1076179 RepID=A0A644Z765_9ZZZZ